MKITGVRANGRKRAFEVATRRDLLVFPYSMANPAPSSEDAVIDVHVDAELANEAFTYTLTSGVEGSVHIDAVLEYNQDPAFMADLALYRLTTQVRQRFETSPLSAREVARRLGTSPAQLYRLLDPTNYSKSARQLLSLLYVLGYDIEVDVKERPANGVVG